jgi:hypothetical protein
MDDMSFVFALAIEMDNALAKALEQAEVAPEEWEDEDEKFDDWRDDCDYEMGFDPYLGCFSDDC